MKEQIISQLRAIAGCNAERVIYTYQFKILMEKYNVPDTEFDDYLLLCRQNEISVTELTDEVCKNIDLLNGNRVEPNAEEKLLNRKCKYITGYLYDKGMQYRQWHGRVQCTFHLDRYKDMIARRIYHNYSAEEIELIALAFGFYKKDVDKLASVKSILRSDIDMEWMQKLENDMEAMIYELSCKPHGITRYRTNIDFYN